jgi:hypothetical protein
MSFRFIVAHPAGNFNMLDEKGRERGWQEVGLPVNEPFPDGRGRKKPSKMPGLLETYSFTIKIRLRS